MWGSSLPGTALKRTNIPCVPLEGAAVLWGLCCPLSPSQELVWGVEMRNGALGVPPKAAQGGSGDAPDFGQSFFPTMGGWECRAQVGLRTPF